MLNDHQPFEEWLLSEATLTPEETIELQEHLRSCESCRRLSLAWEGVEGLLNNSPVVSPAPGFIRRWEMRLAEERARAHRKQTLLILSFGAVGVLLSVLVLGILLLPIIQYPLPFVLIWTYQLVTSFYFVSSVGGALGTVLRAIYELMPPSLWVAICVAIGSLCVLWIVAYQKLTSPRRVML